MNVIKRDGTKEELDIEKMHKAVTWACEGISSVSVSDVMMEAHPQLYNNIKTADIHSTLVQGAVGLIKKNSDYQYVASKLLIFDLYKKVYNNSQPSTLFEMVEKNCKRGVYDKQIVKWYSEDEWDTINSYIKHDRDYDLTYAAISQILDKYLVQDRTKHVYHETPQIMFILIPVVAFRNRTDRLKLIKETYNLLSTFKISLPTPILAGLRTSTRQFSSCCLMSVGDDLNSINSISAALNTYASKRAGIGVDVGRIRAVNSKVGVGEISHTGVIPFYRQFESALKSVAQGGIRGASATLYTPIFHYEIQDIVVLKNNKGTNETRVRQLDYAISWDKFLLRKAIKNEDMFLFSPHDVKDLYEAFYKKDRTEFEELYSKYSQDKKIRKKIVKARDILIEFLKESQETGRLYLFMADNVNQQSVFNIPIYMSNLCCLTGSTEVTVLLDGIQVKISVDELFLNSLWKNAKILAYDFAGNKNIFAEIQSVSLTRFDTSLVNVELLNGRNITCTNDHLIYTVDKGFIHAENLAKHDKLLTCEGYDQVVSITELIKKSEVYDISVPQAKNFFANDVLVHNCEITLPTLPLNNRVTPISDIEGTVEFEGLIQLCTLAAINLGNINLEDTSDMQKRMYILVNLLNEVLDYQDYMVPQARKASMMYRPLGIGVINYAYFLAKNKLTYNDQASFDLTHKLAEQMYFYALRTSIDIAKEKGKLPAIADTIYNEAKTLLDVYNKEVDSVTKEPLHLDWEELKQDLRDYGTYNSTLLALMPSESSSTVSNATNGVEPIRSIYTTKFNKNNTFLQVAPASDKVKYDMLWDMTPKHFEGYIKNMAVFQKFVCQSISTNFSYNPEHFPEDKISMATLINHTTLAAKLGLKTRYYMNTKGLESDKVDSATEENLEDSGGCAESGACKL